MHQAEEAKKRLIEDRLEGERLFDELIRRYPGDGMVYYKRGEAWEKLEEWELGHNDYARAKTLFPMEKWKRIAEDAKTAAAAFIAVLKAVSRL